MSYELVSGDHRFLVGLPEGLVRLRRKGDFPVVTLPDELIYAWDVRTVLDDRPMTVWKTNLGRLATPMEVLAWTTVRGEEDVISETEGPDSGDVAEP